MKSALSKIGPIGAFITFMASPCCFPAVGFMASLFGFGNFELFGTYTKYVLYGLILLSFIGNVFTYRRHRHILPVFLTLLSLGFIVAGYEFIESNRWTTFIYIGISSLTISSVSDYFIDKKRIKISLSSSNMEAKLHSVITCPLCGHTKNELMPMDSCQFFYECQQCGNVLKPKHGDCCVYCSYGTVKCPSVQLGRDCC